MDIVVLEDPVAVGAAGADAIARWVEERTDGALGLATGATPMPVYEALVHRHHDDGLSFAGVRCFLLDEYVGLSTRDPCSYARFIRERFANLVDLPEDHVLGPDGMAEDLDAECRSYEDAIAATGGIALQLLGIGANGHIGFNEPGASFGAATHVEELTARTRGDNARFFPPGTTVPSRVVTQGIGTILRARRILLVATGPAKAEAVVRAVEGPMTTAVPASALQRHARTTVLLDRDAAAMLQRPARPERRP